MTPVMKKYCVSVGWCADDADEDPGLSWEEARARLLEHLTPYQEDNWRSVCRVDATEALARLEHAAPGPFEAEVDGIKYCIAEETSHAD